MPDLSRNRVIRFSQAVSTDQELTEYVGGDTPDVLSAEKREVVAQLTDSFNSTV